MVSFKPWCFKAEQALVFWREGSNSDPSLDNYLCGHCGRITEYMIETLAGGSILAHSLEATVHHGSGDMATFIMAECVARIPPIFLISVLVRVL